MSWSGAERPSPERVPTPGQWLAAVHDAVERQPHLPLLIVALFTVFYLYDCGAPARQPLVERLLSAGASLRESGMAETPDILLRRDLYRVSRPVGSMERESGR